MIVPFQRRDRAASCPPRPAGYSHARRGAEERCLSNGGSLKSRAVHDWGALVEVGSCEPDDLRRGRGASGGVESDIVWLGYAAVLLVLLPRVE